MQQRLRKCLGIDIGTAGVKIAELVAEKNGVRVTQLVRGEVPLPPGPMDAERVAAISKLVRDLISRNKISTKQAVLCVPGQSVFIRRLRVPRTSEERLHRIVAYEARQQIPFALDTSLMEYQVFDYGDSGELEVLLVAIKSDIVTEFMRLVNRLGIKPVMISVTSLALFNFQVFDSTPYAELLDSLKASKKYDVNTAKAAEDATAAPAKAKKGFSLPFGKKKLSADEVAAAQALDDEAPLEIQDLPPADDLYEDVRAYINLGAQTFDLAIGRLGRRKMLGFTRSVMWSGTELTRLLSTKLQMDLAGAEELKRTRLGVGDATTGESGQPVDPDATAVANQWADRLNLEIKKSFDFYIAQPDGMAVDSIVLSGGQAELPGLTAYMEDKLGVPVEVCQRPKNDSIKLTAAADNQELTSYLVSMGLAISGLGLGQVTVDFLPTELKTIREFKRKNVELALMGAALLGMIGFSTQIGQQEISNMRTWLTTNQADLTKANTDQGLLSAARAERTSVEEKVDAIGASIGDRDFWLQFMSMIDGIKPAPIVISALQMEPDGTVRLSAETDPQNLNSVTMFQASLLDQKDWISSVAFDPPPTDTYSRLASKPVKAFTLKIQTNWKQTRLAPTRATLTPGNWTPEPTATSAAGYPMPVGVPGGPAGGMNIPI